MSEVPDRVGYWIGWKGLLADDAGNLFSPNDTRWPVGRALKAKCKGNPDHVPPHRGCGCGIYAVKTYEDLKRHQYHWGEELRRNGKEWVLAELAMYGKYEARTIGYVVGKAAVQTVYVPMQKISLGHTIRRRYGVDLGIINRWTGERKLITGRRK